MHTPSHRSSPSGGMSRDDFEKKEVQVQKKEMVCVVACYVLRGLCMSVRKKRGVGFWYC